MKIVLFSHPSFVASQSMQKFTQMLDEAYRARGHQVQVCSPKARVYNWVPYGKLSKWAGYIDQYLLFPMFVRRELNQLAEGHLFVFTDQALGPWVPLVKTRPHVVHVHDLLALRSALKGIPENPTTWTGQLYQRFIRRGFRQAKHFISISEKTRQDLHEFGQVKPATSEVVYNGLNYPYSPMVEAEAKGILQDAGMPLPLPGMVLHVSGNHWYKNVDGVVRIYAQYARNRQTPQELWLIGDIRQEDLRCALDEVPPQGQVRFFQGLDNGTLQAAYSLARAFLFPSFAEGFGWPIIEAQACGCPVITTGEAPMTEVGGPAARYLPRLMPQDDRQAWARHGADVLGRLLDLEADERASVVAQCLAWPARFDADRAIAGYLRVYQDVIRQEEAGTASNHSRQGTI